jgi:hypothetical protein
VINKLLVIGLAVALSACASGPQITTVQELQQSADAPYDNVLVVSLFESFDTRRYLEKEIVKQLSARGVKAVASTSLMDTRTPVTRATFLEMVTDLDSDAVLVTQLVSLNTGAKMKDMNPQSTHNIRSTYYYNVWSVELTEYVEPQSMELSHTLVLATQLYSVLNKEPVWAIESKSKIVQDYDHRQDYSVFVNEAEAISSQLSRDGLLAP